MVVEHPNQSQPNPGLSPDGTPCISCGKSLAGQKRFYVTQSTIFPSLTPARKYVSLIETPVDFPRRFLRHCRRVCGRRANEESESDAENAEVHLFSVEVNVKLI